MEDYDTVVAVFVDHRQAEAAVKKLAASGFDNRHISVVGRAYDDDAKFGGFYGASDRIKFWGELGAFWGGLWRQPVLFSQRRAMLIFHDMISDASLCVLRGCSHFSNALELDGWAIWGVRTLSPPRRLPPRRLHCAGQMSEQLGLWTGGGENLVAGQPEDAIEAIVRAPIYHLAAAIMANKTG